MYAFIYVCMYMCVCVCVFQCVCACVCSCVRVCMCVNTVEAAISIRLQPNLVKTTSKMSYVGPIGSHHLQKP